MAVTIAGVLAPALTLRISSQVQKFYSDISCLTSYLLFFVFFLHFFFFPPLFFLSTQEVLLKHP